MSGEHMTRQQLLSSAGSLKRWALEPDRTAATSPARTAFLNRFEHQVDPDGVLPPDERARRAAKLRKAHFREMAVKSAEARRQAKTAARPAPSGTTHLVPVPESAPVPVQAEQEPETQPGVDRGRRGAGSKRDPFAAMATDESRMADRIDEAFGGAS